MSITVRKYEDRDIPAMVSIWNEVVRDGVAFPQLNELSINEGRAFFAEQTLSAVAEENGVVLGLYILHPNNIGRCGHIANASYAVASYARGKGIGERLVIHCLENAGSFGYKLLQFNAVVGNNHAALSLYEKLGFIRLGTIPEGFLLPDGTYEDIVLFYHRV